MAVQFRDSWKCTLTQNETRYLSSSVCPLFTGWHQVKWISIFQPTHHGTVCHNTPGEYHNKAGCLNVVWFLFLFVYICTWYFIFWGVMFGVGWWGGGGWLGINTRFRYNWGACRLMNTSFPVLRVEGLEVLKSQRPWCLILPRPCTKISPH